MRFTATGGILSGSAENPNYITYIELPVVGQQGSSQSTSNTWNALGYCPVVSTFTGLGRILVATVHSIVHLVAALFDKHHRGHHLKEAKLGGVNILRGSIELIPVAGNLGLLIYDVVMHTKEPKPTPDQPGVIVMYDSQKVAEMDFSTFLQKLRNTYPGVPLTKLADDKRIAVALKHGHISPIKYKVITMNLWGSNFSTPVPA